MNNEQLWQAYTDKNPHWIASGAAFTPEGLEKLVAETWKHAFRSGYDSGVRVGAAASMRSDDMMFDEDPALNRFKDIFR